MTELLTLVKALSRLDTEIDTLRERLAAKQQQRREVVDALRHTPYHTRGGNGVGSGHHSTPRGPAKGTPNHRTRSLKPAQVRRLRKMWATGKYTQRELGERFGGLPQPVVSSIVHRRTYQDVT